MVLEGRTPFGQQQDRVRKQKQKNGSVNFSLSKAQRARKATKNAMTSSAAQPSKPLQNNEGLEALRLSTYLDLLPQPAIIFTFNGPTITADSLKVCYVNDLVWEVIGEQQNPEREEFVHTTQTFPPGVSRDFKLLLHAQLHTPSTPTFVEWLNEVRQQSKLTNHLKTRFKGYFAPKETTILDRAPQFVDIEWNAVLMEKKYIVLIGKRTGTVQFSSSPSPEPNSADIAAKLPSPIDEDDEDDKDDPKPTTHKSGSSSSISSSSSAPVRTRRKHRKRHNSSTATTTNSSRGVPSSFTDEDGSDEVDPWRNDSKLVKAMGGGGKCGEMMRQMDWSKTPLGPITSWSQTLLTMTSLVMSSTHPMALWWTTDPILIYNDSYSQIIGDRHPKALGGSAKEFWAELFPEFDSILEGVFRGESVYTEDGNLLVYRYGYPEETYFTWSYIPIRDATGNIAGFLNPCFESTSRVLAERRLRTLREIESHTASARSMSELGTSIAKAFTYNPYDIPFALVYFCTSDYGPSSLYAGSYIAPESSGDLGRRSSLLNSTSSSANGTDQTEPNFWVYRLQDTVGIPEGHVIAPKVVEVHVNPTDEDEEAEDVHLWPFRKMAQLHSLIPVGNIPPGSLDGIKHRHQGWPELPTGAVAVPILGPRDTSGSNPLLGMLVLGLNPRREFDHDFRAFSLMCGQAIAAAMALVKNIEDEASRAEELATLNRDRTSFFNTVSHELRTPLTLILGPLEELITDKSMSQSVRSKLEMMRRNGRRLLRLVNSILDFSRVEAGKMSASFRETNLQSYTADLASLFRSAIEKGGVKYVVDLTGKERAVWVDRDMWEKIVFNILSNAFKFTLTGQITVKCHLSDDNRYMIFSVSDTGTGIPPHEMTRIFEKFHRVHDPKGRSYEGTGIGLALTQELVKLHGGELDVESTYGHGTTFIIKLRIGNSHLPADQLVTGKDYSDVGTATPRPYGESVVEEADRWNKDAHPNSVKTFNGGAGSTTSSETGSTIGAPHSTLVPISSRGCRVLVADDNDDMRRYVKGVLVQFYDVIEASNGQDALALALQEHPDLILSDIMMPGLSGFGLLKVLRSSPELRTTPFILLSAKAGEEARVEGLLAGADDYLAKPFSARELIARVHTHLDIAKMRIELEKRVKERTKDLMESEERYRILSAISPAGIFRVDRSGMVTYANQKWREITGIDETLDDSAGENFLSAVHPDDRDEVSRKWQGALKNTEIIMFEARWGTPESFRWAMGEVVPEVIGDEVLGFVGVLTDVTDRRQAESDKLDAAEEVRAQQELAIDVICHELRNPLNGIYHNADIVMDSMKNIQDVVLKFRDELLRAHKAIQLSEIALGPEDARSIAHLIDFLDSELTQDLESIESLNLCARHQKRIADDVLQMSKLSMNLVSLAKTPFDPLVETSNVIRMFEREAFVKDIMFKFTLGTEYRNLQLGWVLADPIRFSQVLLNFISNAVRFTEKSEHREIEVTLDASATKPKLSNPLNGTADITHSRELEEDTSGPMIYLIASVADSGVGLTREEQANLFQKFSQASPKTHIEYGGSGLGLFISKALVEVQGGRISLESQKDEGTTLSFYIQARKVQPPAPPSDSIPARSLSPRIMPSRTRRNPSSTSSVPQLKTHKVLIVEDNLINQKVLTRQLKLAGFDTDVAGNGLECLQKVTNEEGIDCILMDLEMPVMSGIVAATEIRNKEEAGEIKRRIPIIAVTGNARTEYVEKTSAVGFDGFIVKPYEKQDLIDKIRSLIEKQ